MSGGAKGRRGADHVRCRMTPGGDCSRIVTGTADVLIAADEWSRGEETITLCESQRTHGVINTHLIPIADFILNRDFDFQRSKVHHLMEASPGRARLLRLHPRRGIAARDTSPPT